MKEHESLRQFVELARTLHFGQAARACHVSPSTLSRGVQRLEAQLAEQLLEREHHKVTLTAAGEAFQTYALAALDEWRRFEQNRALSRGQLSGTIRMYCTVTAAQSIVPDLLGRVRRQYPGIRIELETGYAADAIDQLRGGEVDVSVAALPDRLPAGIASRILARTPVIFVTPSVDGPVHDEASRRSIDWSKLPVVLPAQGLARDYVDEWFERRGITPTLYAQIQGHEAILSLVALGCGAGVVPRLVLEKSALQDRIAELSVRPPLRRFRIALCVRRSSLANSVVAAVWNA